MEPSIDNHFSMIVLLILALARTTYSIVEIAAVLRRQRKGNHTSP